MTRNPLSPSRRAWIATAVLLAVTLAVLLAMDRPLICTCGQIKLWHGEVQSSGNSQHITDWYSPSHFIHGLIMYFFGWLLWVSWGLFSGRLAKWALPIAVFVEAVWEVVENTPMIIDRYREVTVSFGYVGDSIVNSMADIGWMMAGFLIAFRLPWKVSVAIAVLFELLTLWIIRDNLTLNVVMLFWPIEAIREWQALG